jgi:hypothetical protein
MFRNVAEFEALTGKDKPTTAERKLIEATRAGEPCVLCDPANPSRPEKASDKTRIRAPLLRLLILGGTPDCKLHETGVTLFGGWIEGALDLAYCTARGQTLLNFCCFTDRPSFYNAHLRQLDLDDSAFPGLTAQGARIEADLFLRRIAAKGAVDVNGAVIDGQLACEGARLHGTGGMALDAQGVKVGAGLFLSNLTAKGTVDVNSAEIGGQLDCEGARLHGAGGKALNAQGVKVGASLFLRKLTAKGTVVVSGAEIGGQLACVSARFLGAGGMALNAHRLRVERAFFLRNLAIPPTGRLDLSGAHVGDLVDDAASWPLAPDDLVLDGFTYDRIDGGNNTSFAARRRWLEAGSTTKGEFRPQPYTQLAKVLRQMGHAGEARKVLIARTLRQGQANRAARWNGVKGPLGTLWAGIRNVGHLCLDRLSLWVAGYGQDAARSLWWLVGLWLAATSLAQLAWEEGSFAPNSAIILVSPGWELATAKDCFPRDTAPADCTPNPARLWSDTFTAQEGDPTMGADWDSFNRYAYAADLVVPFLDLGQTAAWAPSKDRGGWGWILWWARWVLATLGWVVTGLGVAAVTGVMQRNQPE